MKAPAITVLMPVYNAERYVAKAIDSILNQTFTDYEFIIVNDGSTDKSLQILQDYSNKDNRIKLVDRENKGLVATLNKGIAQAKAPLLARMDADDICLPERFQKQHYFLKKHSECVLVGSRVLFIDEDDDPLMLNSPQYDHADIDNAHLTAMIHGAPQICHPSVMIRVSALRRVGCYDYRYEYAEDAELFLRLAEIGKLENLHDVLLKYRQHFTQICSENKQKQLQNMKKAIEETCRRRGIDVPKEVECRCKVKRVNAGKFDIHRKWGWWALSGGYTATARKHAIKAFLSRPLNSENLRLLACAVRGY